MTTREFLRKLFRGELGRLDALNISSGFTNGEKLKIKMLIAEIDECCEKTNIWFRYAIMKEWIYDREEEDEPTSYHYTQLVNKDFKKSTIKEIDKRVKHFLGDSSPEDLLKDENLDYEKLFYPILCKSLYQLRTDLSDLIDKDKENTPFENEQTKNLFEYIVKNWKNDTANKWGYIWIHIVELNNGNLTTKGDYETYLRKYHNFTKGKPNYDSCNSKTRFEELDKLNKEFLENLDLN